MSEAETPRTQPQQHPDMPVLPPLGSPTTPPAPSPLDNGIPATPSAPPSEMTTTPPQHTGEAPTRNYGIPTPFGHQAAPEPGVPAAFGGSAPVPPKPEQKKRRLGTGGVIGIAAATALIVGAGSAVGTWLLLPSDSPSLMASSSTVVQASANDTNWTAVAEQVENSVVSVQVESSQGTSQGSGVVWDGQGHIVTNNHVVEGASGGTVIVTIGNRGYEASVLGTDPATDLAVLEVKDPPDTLVPLTVGDSEALEVGDGVMAIGSPLGLSGSYTTGIVSALDRPVTTGEVNGNAVVTNAIQTSAALNPGNSGGALVDASGQLIGINSSIATLGSSEADSQSGSIGIGFAIPTALVQNVAEQLITNGAVEHAWLGSANTDGTAEFEGSMILGAEVREVTAGGPAEEAGLKAGDLIVRVDDQEVSSSSSLIGVVRTYRAGDKVTLTVIRNGAQTEIEVTLGVSPTLNG